MSLNIRFFAMTVDSSSTWGLFLDSIQRTVVLKRKLKENGWNCLKFKFQLRLTKPNLLSFSDKTYYTERLTRNSSTFVVSQSSGLPFPICVSTQAKSIA